MSAAERVPTTVVGRRSVMSRRERTLLVTVAIFYAALVGWRLSQGEWTMTGAFLVWVAWLIVIRFRRPTQVDSSGIRRHWRLRGFVDWRDVDRVASPQPGIGSVRLWMKNGRTLTLDDVAVDRSDSVAAIGDVPVGFPPRPTPPPRPTQRSDGEIEADVDRRARALAERGKQLDAEYRRLRGLGRSDETT